MSIASAGNDPLVGTGSWRPDPTFRGTEGIVSTCLSTLVICVWSAIHIDIPRQPSRWTPLKKLHWLVIGLFVPDLLLLRAFVQLHGSLEVSKWAKAHLVAEKTAAIPTWWGSLCEVVRRYVRCKSFARSLDPPEDGKDVMKTARLDDTESGAVSVASELSILKNAWTMYHSFYVVMGGFALDSSSTSVVGTGHRLFLTLPMLKLIWKHVPETIPDIPRDRIQSWSKSSWVAKALLVAQLLYFTVSCAARLAQALPLSLLEVWTLAHALGAIIAYAIWWEKPLNLIEPTMIIGDTASEFAAFLQVVGRPGNHKCSADPEVAFLEVTPCESSEHPQVTLDDGLILLPHQPIQIEGYSFGISSATPAKDPAGIFDAHDCPWWLKERGPKGSVELTQTDITRWQLAARAATRMGGGCLFRRHPDIKYFVLVMKPFEQFDRSISGEIAGPIPPLGATSTAISRAVLLYVMMTAYELPHLLGWSSVFPSHVERMLWRIASIFVAATPTIALCSYIAPIWGGIWHTVAKVSFTVMFVLYAVANAYLLVESLRQLSCLPDGAFSLPNLSIYFPHFA